MVANQLPTSGLLVTKCRDLATDELPEPAECMLGAMIYTELHRELAAAINSITSPLVLRFRTFASGALYGLDWEFNFKPSEATCEPACCDGRFALESLAQSGPYLTDQIVAAIKRRLAEVRSENRKRAELAAQAWAGMLGNGSA